MFKFALCLSLMSLTAFGEVIFEDNFDKAPQPAWKGDEEMKTFAHPKNGQFLGPVGPGKKTGLQLSHLPAHQALRLSFELQLNGDWDGLAFASQPPGRFAVVLDQREFLSSSFNNIHGMAAGSFSAVQSFPDSYREEQWKWCCSCNPQNRDFVQASAARINSLFQALANQSGLGAQPSGKEPYKYDHTLDLYRLEFVFLHQSDKLDLSFLNPSSKPHYKYKPAATFGLGKVKIETVTVDPLTPAAEAELWERLFSDDRLLAAAAKYQLALHPDLVARKFAILLPRADDLDLPQLIADLEAGPGVRRKASQLLLSRGRAVRQDLKEELARRDPLKNPELCGRLSDLIGAIDGTDGSRIDKLSPLAIWRLADLTQLCPELAPYRRRCDSLVADALTRLQEEPLAPAKPQ